MEDDDPFASLTDLCNISSSQEEYLGRCRFALEPEDDRPLSSDNEYSDIPLESTGIVMLSPPETPKENQNDDDDASHDVFVTPPEESMVAGSQEKEKQQPVGADVRDVVMKGNAEHTVAVDCDCGDGSRTVDLGTHTDLGFSVEAELMQRCERHSGENSLHDVNRADKSKVIYCESLKSRVLGRDLVQNDGLCKSPLKKLKISHENTGLVTPKLCWDTEVEKRLGILLCSTEKLESPLRKSKLADNNLGLETPKCNLGMKAEIMLNRFVKSMEKLRSPFKKPKTVEKSLVLENSRDRLDSETDHRRENWGESVEISNLEGVNLNEQSIESLKNVQLKEVLIETHSDNMELHEEFSAKRRLEFSTEILESNCEENTAGVQFNEGGVEGKENQAGEANRLYSKGQGHSGKRSIDDLNKFQYVGPSISSSHEKEQNIRQKRALPLSVCETKQNSGERKVESDDVLSPQNHNEITLLDVLRMLAENHNNDPSLENISIFEAAKRRGMSFP